MSNFVLVFSSPVATEAAGKPPREEKVEMIFSHLLLFFLRENKQLSFSLLFPIFSSQGYLILLLQDIKGRWVRREREKPSSSHIHFRAESIFREHFWTYILVQIMYTVSNAILLAIWGLVNSKKAKQLLFFSPITVLRSAICPAASATAPPPRPSGNPGIDTL